jgi:hypothetical protein
VSVWTVSRSWYSAETHAVGEKGGGALATHLPGAARIVIAARRSGGWRQPQVGAGTPGAAGRPAETLPVGGP